MSTTRLGKKLGLMSVQGRINISESHKGLKLSLATRQKMSEQRKGKLHPMYGKHHTEEAKVKIGIAGIGRVAWNKGLKGFLAGEKHWHWKKDRTQVKLDTERDGPLHKQWSKNVKSRDGWKCRIANGDCSGRLESHHILGWKSHPDLRYQINNGITLCHFHHPRTRAKENELSPYFQKLVLTREGKHFGI